MKILKKVMNLVKIGHPRRSVQVQLKVKDIKNNIAAIVANSLQLIIGNLIIFWANIVKRRITAMNQE